MPRRGFWDARRDAASHFIRGASMAWRWTPSPRSRVFLTQVAPKEAPARVPAGHGVAGRAASNRDLVAAEPKEQTVAILEDDVVALPVACGEMAFRGDALEPIIKQRGPWAVRLELKGVHEKPLAGRDDKKEDAPQRIKGCCWSCSRRRTQLNTIQHIGVLELYQGGRRSIFPVVCELIEDLDAISPSISARVFVKCRYGADVVEKAVSARSLLLQKRAPRSSTTGRRKE